MHVASPLGGFENATVAVPIGIKGALNALNACAKVPSVKRFVFTSSSLAASFPKPNIECSIDENSYNEEAVDIVKKDPTIKGLYIYSALKAETEKAVWQWMKDHRPNFVINTIVHSLSYLRSHISTNWSQLPNANFGRVLVPRHQGLPSTIDWAHAAWTGDQLEAYATVVKPQWFISPNDTAILHISALIHGEVESERLFAYAERFSYNNILAIYRRLYPQKKFPEYLQDEGTDKMSVPNKRAEEVLRWVKASGWDSLEKSVKDMSEEWTRE